ncbi:MAG TPA: hypothetical protein VMB71_13115 [Acetobacteraceae bacterium]|nr:hypothetical protein [Acetobacteraceae bacterium]
MLLVRALPHRPRQGTPIIQIANCTAQGQSREVASALALACARLVGRTLLATLDPLQAGALDPSDQVRPLPDAFVPGLFHYCIGHGATDASMLFGLFAEQGVAALTAPFRIAIIDVPEPASPGGLALAPFCACTMLVVEAGRTPLAAVQATSDLITGAGGKVIGTILSTARAEARRSMKSGRFIRKR